MKTIFEDQFQILNLPINVIGNSSNNSGTKINLSVFVQKHYLRTNYVEANIEEDIDMKNYFKIKNLLCPEEHSDAVCKSHLNSGLKDPSIIRNTAHVDFNDKNIDKVKFVKVNSLPAVGEHLTAKYYVDNSISNSVEEASC